MTATGEPFDCDHCGRADAIYYALGLCRRCYGATWARRQVPPDDYDEAAVLRLMQGERLPLWRADRIEATRRLTACGHSARQIADILGTTTRTVCRDRQALVNARRSVAA